MSQKQIDKRFNILSYEQYLIDHKKMKFSKMSMTEVVGADMMIARFGEEQYYKTCTEILERGNEAYRQLGLDTVIHVYAHTYRTFMAVANDAMSDEDFLNLMKGFYDQYELVNAKTTGLGGVSRFALVFGDNLINRARSAFYLHTDMQQNFIVVSDEKEKLTATTEEDLRIFETLNYALNNNQVVPFYQGIHDNKTGKISKYEALMRVYDSQGKLYPPGLFLETSKKLKLYLQLSKVMLDKALRDFENNDNEICLNISLFDIQTQDFRNWFLERIKKHPNPSKVIIEFVETENYNNNEDLALFLDKVRSIGCKIAVDDFGVGFATYTSIVSLKPEIIKIDGDIIKNLTKTKESNLILDSICYMAKLIGSEITAEFVEDSNIQKIVNNNNIHYSQGYHFAKPEPFENLSFD